MRSIKTIGIIPARGGSKGIPGKNLAPLLGKPLIQWTIEASKGSNRLSNIVLSSDDDEIIAVARKAGIDVPFKRPHGLASDDALVIDVITHTLEWLRKNRQAEYDYVCLIQPTAPLTIAEDYDSAIKLAIENNADTVISIRSSGSFHPAYMCLLEENDRVKWYVENPPWGSMPRRQDLPPVHIRCGNVYVIKTSLILNHRKLYGEKLFAYNIPDDRAIDIDTPMDLKLAEFILDGKIGW